jgi:large subunit ribosomal protein L15
MNITEITTRAGAHEKRRRVGRGEGSGMGKTSGRGNKGQKSRSGGAKDIGLLSEGGAFSLFRRLPKVGFNNFHFRTEYQIVNTSTLEERFPAGGHVTAAALEVAGMIRDEKLPVKILGDGNLTKKLTVEAQRFSKSAVTKIEGCGGTVKRLGSQPKKKFVKRAPPPVEKVDKKAAKAEKKALKKAQKKAQPFESKKPDKASKSADKPRKEKKGEA